LAILVHHGFYPTDYSQLGRISVEIALLIDGAACYGGAPDTSRGFLAGFSSTGVHLLMF